MPVFRGPAGGEIDCPASLARPRPPAGAPVARLAPAASTVRLNQPAGLTQVPHLAPAGHTIPKRHSRLVHLLLGAASAMIAKNRSNSMITKGF